MTHLSEAENHGPLWCDRCQVARAAILVVTGSGPLRLCAHHAHSHYPALAAAGYQIIQLGLGDTLMATNNNAGYTGNEIVPRLFAGSIASGTNSNGEHAVGNVAYAEGDDAGDGTTAVASGAVIIRASNGKHSGASHS